MSEENPLMKKSYQFALLVIQFCRKHHTWSIDPLFRQLLRSGTGIRANLEEAVAGASRKDFLAKMVIAHKEAREANYWLRLLRDSTVGAKDEIQKLLSLSVEMKKMLTASVKTTKARPDQTPAGTMP
ncbi:MAG: four helix bundle protein [Planctomycetes bacterium]|nr:four helix bundle protein [Planctomycetota bacterium]